MKSLKLLIISGATGKLNEMEEFSCALEKLGVNCKIVQESDFGQGFPSKDFANWFNTKTKKLLNEFKPDAVYVDRQAHFCVQAINSKIPVFVHLRGHYWQEIEAAKKTIYKSKIMHLVIWLRDRIAKKCFEKSTAVLPNCTYLKNVVEEHHQHQSISVLNVGIHSEDWYDVKGMSLKHPCVGLLQDANWWGKTKEMLILKNVVEELPNVNFYWAGDGKYRERVLSVLDKFDNFHWLKRLDYPNQVRQYLTEIDIYALITGMDLEPRTLNEAQLMRKAIIATKVGGIPEFLIDEKSGFLVREGNYQDIIEKIQIFLNDRDRAIQMGKHAQTYVKENLKWEKIAKKFLNIAEKYMK